MNQLKMHKKINLWVEGTGTTDWILRGFFEAHPLNYEVNTITLSNGQDWGNLSDGINIFIRASHPAYRSLPMYLKKTGIEYIYFIDDNFWEIKGNTLLANHYRNALLHLTLERFIRDAKIVITCSLYLKKYVEDKYNVDNVVFCQAPVDIGYIDAIAQNHVFVKPKESIRIGYAGVPKTDDFIMVWSALKKIRNNYKNVEIEFFGDGYDEFVNEERVTVIRGLPDLKNYYFNQIARNWDIGLAPLLDNTFTKSKTENKFREYGAMKIAGIYSNIKIYNAHVIDGQNGILAEQNAESWYLAIERLISDQSLRKQISDNAYVYAKENFHFNAVAVQWSDAINAVSAGLKSPSKIMSKLAIKQSFNKIYDKDIDPNELTALIKFDVKQFLMTYLVRFKSPVVILLLLIVLLQIFSLLKK